MVGSKQKIQKMRALKRDLKFLKNLKTPTRLHLIADLLRIYAFIVNYRV